ncbi:hypothetical protein L1049_017430 [Liquidambar formosana]|uniref:Cellulose synthase-like protein G2 n=1 Tax=Liquidambar formosana TaxID=63359 RepID=A0AAP0S366_LIQFO
MFVPTREEKCEAMEDSLPLHLCHVQKPTAIINRSHAFFHSIALTALVYYRVSYLFQDPRTRDVPTLLWLMIFASELLLSFIWLLNQAYRWRPVSRAVFPERLPVDKELPAIDVFICTADPNREPTFGVMNTVLSAMALDYPPEKLYVYLSDDGGSPVTLQCMREAWGFAKWWLPFCRTYGIKTRCPGAYFSALDGDNFDSWGNGFIAQRQMVEVGLLCSLYILCGFSWVLFIYLFYFITHDKEIIEMMIMLQGKYEVFKEQVMKAREMGRIGDKSISTCRDHPPVVEVIHDNSTDALGVDQAEMPLLVYVSREKRPSHAHHFKAGALNVLLRVSGIISNSSYILVLDCDMYCNDPSSARQAMYFHLDPKISATLAFVQFPQKFHNLSKNDIYDGRLRSAFALEWHGFDGLKGPVLSGTGFYIKRDALYGRSIQEDIDIMEIKQSFGPSNEFVKSLFQKYKPNAVNGQDSSSTMPPETQILASCAYENRTKWGEEVGFYYSVVEDYLTGLILHCKGWTSIYNDQPRPHFMGSATTNLNDVLIQATRWSTGLIDVCLSRFCPLIYGPLRMSILQSMCYGELAFFPFYCWPVWCLATIPQLCVLNGIPLYPKVSNPFFLIFSFIFLSSLAKHLHEVLITGGSIRAWINEQRIWMIKSVTSHLYGSLDAIMKKIGLREASFLPTNKAEDDEQVKSYQMGIFDFRTSTKFLAPMVSLVILNMASFVGGLARMIIAGDWDRTFVQVFLSFFILIINYPIIEGMIVRKDKGRITPNVTLLSAVFSMIFLSLGSIVLAN